MYELQRLDVRVDEPLRHAFVGVNPIVLREDSDEGIVASERRASVGWSHQADQDLALSSRDQSRDGGLGRHTAVDLLLVDTRDEGVAGTNCDEMLLGWVDTRLAQDREC